MQLSKHLALGKEAYSCGEYAAAVRLLEVATEELGQQTVLGGEAQLWLALAYQACGRETECVDLYKYLEANHPLPRVRKQAADLRYIIEAPKLVIGPDERVTIPLLQTDTWRQKERKPSFTSRLPAPPKASTKASYWDSVTWGAATPLTLPDKWYVRVAWLVLLVGFTIYANTRLVS
ncbi:hypothetical protein V8C86DRAFT_1176484 [Haematococcus lacustris]